MRSRLRRVAAGLFVVLLVAGAAGLAVHLYGGYRFDRAVAELETFLGTRLDLDLARFNRPSPPKDDNAIRGFIIASKALDLSQDERENLNAVRDLPFDAWPALEVTRKEPQTEPPEMTERLRLLMAKYRHGLELLHQAAERKHSSYGLTFRSGREPVLPILFFALTETKLLTAEARLAFAQRDMEGGLRAARTLSRLGDCLDEEHPEIFHWIAVSIERSLNQLALEMASSPEPWAARTSLLSGLAALLPVQDRSALIEESLLFDALERSLAARDAWRRVEWRSFSPVSGFVTGPLEGSRILSGHRQVLGFARRPIGRLYQERNFSPDRLDELARSAFYFAAVSQVVASQSQLTRAALALRSLGLADGRYPRERPKMPALTRNEPAAGRRITYRLLEDGSLRLEAEGAEELWKRTGPKAGRRYTFRVTLPPPPAPSRAL